MRHVLVKLALIGFLCRALVPAGFMPAPISDGGPIRFCPGGPAGALLSALVEQRSSALSAEQSHADHHLHQHTDHEQNANHEGWDRCPVGTAFAFAVLAYDFALPLLPLEHALERSDSDLPALRLLPAHYQARAPPRV